MQSQWTSPPTFTGNWQNLPDLMRSEHLMGFLSLKAILLPSWTFERHRGSEEANIWVKCRTWQNLITRQICWWTLTSPVGHLRHLWHLWPHLLDTSPLWSRFFSATPSPSSSGTPRWRPLKNHHYHQFQNTFLFFWNQDVQTLKKNVWQAVSFEQASAQDSRLSTFLVGN